MLAAPWGSLPSAPRKAPASSPRLEAVLGRGPPGRDPPPCGPASSPPLPPPDPETPLDCEVSLWSSWGLCAGPCGRLGAKSRTRYVRVRPANHGAPCPPLEEEAPCGPDNCV